MTVAGDVHETKVWIFGVDIWDGLERSESLPTAVGCTLVEAGHRTVELDEIQMTFSSEIEQLLPPAAQRRQGRLGRDLLDRAKCAIAEIALVIPGVGLLGQDAGQSLAIEVDPLITGPIDAVR